MVVKGNRACDAGGVWIVDAALAGTLPCDGHQPVEWSLPERRIKHLCAATTNVGAARAVAVVLNKAHKVIRDVIVQEVNIAIRLHRPTSVESRLQRLAIVVELVLE
eukprot:SAG31_NODE_1625_length_7716_cov_23.849941_5_plen_106_part_00